MSEKEVSLLDGSAPKTAEVTEGIRILWGSVLSATLSFLIPAAVVCFLMVLPVAKYLARRAAVQAANEGVQETMEVSEPEVLKEIRDALVAQRSGSGPVEGNRGEDPGQGRQEQDRGPGGGGLRRGGAASRRGNGPGRRRCHRRGPAHPTPGPYRPRTAGPADRRRSVPAWASAGPASSASNRAVRGRGRYSYLQGTAALRGAGAHRSAPREARTPGCPPPGAPLSGPWGRATRVRVRRGRTGRGIRRPTRRYRCCPPSIRR